MLYLKLNKIFDSLVLLLKCMYSLLSVATACVSLRTPLPSFPPDGLVVVVAMFWVVSITVVGSFVVPVTAVAVVLVVVLSTEVVCFLGRRW